MAKGKVAQVIGTVVDIEFPPDERAKLVAKAETVWEKWVKKAEKRGLPAREVLDYYLSKRKEIAGY